MTLPQVYLDNHNDQHILQGLKDVAGVQPRKDIDRLLWEDPDAFNLFLLALEELKAPKMDSDPMGYTELAGIHGMPRREWDGIPGKRNHPDHPEQKKKEGYVTDSGYCAHGVNRFPTWHRPYLAMFEQSLFIRMDAIADRYVEPHKARYQAASRRFRLPYWDYYRPRGGPVTFPGIIKGGKTSFPYDYSCPKVFQSEAIMVRKPPNNELVRMDSNPLHHYEFRGIIPETDWKDLKLDEAWYPRKITVRYPRHNSAWKTPEETMNLVLNSLRMDSNRLAIELATGDAYKTYESFATTAKKFPELPDDATAEEFFNGPASGSLECLHNIYHDFIGGNAIPRSLREEDRGKDPEGGGGHMSRVAVAAFDPVFWMHHCQIDRIFAIWQAVHANSEENWFKDPADGTLPAIPFRKTAGEESHNFWNGDQSRETATFGYFYPEAADASPEEVVKRYVGMYKWSLPRQDSKDPIKAPEDMEPVDVMETQFFNFAAASTDTASEPAVAPPPPLLSEMPEYSGATIVLPERVKEKVDKDSGDSRTGIMRDWFIDSQVQRMALNGSFTIFYFITQAGKSIASSDGTTSCDLTLEPSLVGLHYIFASPKEFCSSCASQEAKKEIVSNSVPITSSLLDFVKIGELQSLDEKHVVPFLQERLKWKVVTANGEQKDPRKLAHDKDLKLMVSTKTEDVSAGSSTFRYATFPEIVRKIIDTSPDTFSGI